MGLLNPLWGFDSLWTGHLFSSANSHSVARQVAWIGRQRAILTELRQEKAKLLSNLAGTSTVSYRFDAGSDSATSIARECNVPRNHILPQGPIDFKRFHVASKDELNEVIYNLFWQNCNLKLAFEIGPVPVIE